MTNAAARMPKFSVQPCQEEDDQGQLYINWDITRDGKCVRSGVRTRAEARQIRNELKAEAAEQIRNAGG